VNPAAFRWGLVALTPGGVALPPLGTRTPVLSSRAFSEHEKSVPEVPRTHVSNVATNLERAGTGRLIAPWLRVADTTRQKSPPPHPNGFKCDARGVGPGLVQAG
jgi:hypothetical protein